MAATLTMSLTPQDECRQQTQDGQTERVLPQD